MPRRTFKKKLIKRISNLRHFFFFFFRHKIYSNSHSFAARSRSRCQRRSKIRQMRNFSHHWSIDRIIVGKWSSHWRSSDTFSWRSSLRIERSSVGIPKGKKTMVTRPDYQIPSYRLATVTKLHRCHRRPRTLGRTNLTRFWRRIRLGFSCQRLWSLVTGKRPKLCER